METATRLGPERFAEGMSLQDFVDNMQKNRDLFDANYRNFALKEEDEEFFRAIDENLNVLVLAEDWCGDVLRYLPVFKRISEAVRAIHPRLVVVNRQLPGSRELLADVQRTPGVTAVTDEELLARAA